MAIYTLLALILMVMILKVVWDIADVARLRRIRRTSLALASQYYQPRLLVLIEYSSLAASQAAIEQLAGMVDQQPNSKAVILLDAATTELDEVKLLRDWIATAGFDWVRASCVKNSDVFMYARHQAHRYDLVMAIPDVATVNPNLYHDIVLPLGDSELDAVSAPSLVTAESTVASAGQSIVRLLGNRLIPASRSPEVILKQGGVVRASCLRMDSINRLATPGALYSQPASLSTASVSQYYRIAIPGVMLLATLIASWGTQYQGLVVGLSLATAYYLTWQLTNGGQLGLYQRLMLILVAPFVYIGLVWTSLTGLVAKLGSLRQSTAA